MSGPLSGKISPPDIAFVIGISNLSAKCRKCRVFWGERRSQNGRIALALICQATLAGDHPQHKLAEVHKPFALLFCNRVVPAECVKGRVKVCRRGGGKGNHSHGRRRFFFGLAAVCPEFTRFTASMICASPACSLISLVPPFSQKIIADFWRTLAEQVSSISKEQRLD
jgi:hypothetical protein